MWTKLINFFVATARAANPVTLLQPFNANTNTTVSSVNDYIKLAFPVFLGAAISLSVVFIAWGGLQYALSVVPGAKEDGKKKISNAIWGLLLALAAWIILETINPQINTAGTHLLGS